MLQITDEMTMTCTAPALLQGLFDLVCTPEGQAFNTAQLLVFQPPQAQAGGRGGRSKATLNGTDRDMTPLVVGTMHDTTAIHFRVVGAHALGQLAAVLQSHAGVPVRMLCLQSLRHSTCSTTNDGMSSADSEPDSLPWLAL
jgi:hypothetical protein